jgi:hypothetical protein
MMNNSVSTVFLFSFFSFFWSLRCGAGGGGGFLVVFSDLSSVLYGGFCFILVMMNECEYEDEYEYEWRGV